MYLLVWNSGGRQITKRKKKLAYPFKMWLWQTTNITRSFLSDWKQQVFFKLNRWVLHLWAANRKSSWTPNKKHMETFSGCLVIKHMSSNMSACFQWLSTYGPSFWLPRRWNHFSCAFGGHLAQDAPLFHWNKPEHVFVTLCGEPKNNTVNSWGFFLFVLQEKSLRDVCEMIGCFKNWICNWPNAWPSMSPSLNFPSTIWT